MDSLVISDLHLGARQGHDVLRRDEPVARLAHALEGYGRLVLLGDIVELREKRVAAALEDAAPALRAMGAAMKDGEVVVVPGNHDHQLAAGWFERRRLEDGAGPLQLEHTVDPGGEGLGARVTELLAPARVRMAYPGVWLRSDVYATHGHYLDLHTSVPNFEAVAASGAARMLGRRVDSNSVDGHEAPLAPVYSFAYLLAQGAPGGPPGAGLSARMWTRLNSPSVRNLVPFLVGAGLLRGGVAAINLTGIGRFSADLSLEELSRAGIQAMRATAERLGIDAAHVIYGHTHRAGALDGEPGWRLRGGTLWNSGTWVYSPGFIGADGPRSPYWPGRGIRVPESGPPEPVSLLDELTPRELATRG